MADALTENQLRLDRLPSVAQGVIVPAETRHEVVYDQFRDADAAGGLFLPGNAAARHLLGQLGDPPQLAGIGLSRLQFRADRIVVPARHLAGIRLDPVIAAGQFVLDDLVAPEILRADRAVAGKLEP